MPHIEELKEEVKIPEVLENPIHEEKKESVANSEQLVSASNLEEVLPEENAGQIVPAEEASQGWFWSGINAVGNAASAVGNGVASAASAGVNAVFDVAAAGVRTGAGLQTAMTERATELTGPLVELARREPETAYASYVITNDVVNVGGFLGKGFYHGVNSFVDNEGVSALITAGMMFGGSQFAKHKERQFLQEANIDFGVARQIKGNTKKFFQHANALRKKGEEVYALSKQVTDKIKQNSKKSKTLKTALSKSPLFETLTLKKGMYAKRFVGKAFSFGLDENIENNPIHLTLDTLYRLSRKLDGINEHQSEMQNAIQTLNACNVRVDRIRELQESFLNSDAKIYIDFVNSKLRELNVLDEEILINALNAKNRIFDHMIPAISVRNAGRHVIAVQMYYDYLSANYSNSVTFKILGKTLYKPFKFLGENHFKMNALWGGYSLFSAGWSLANIYRNKALINRSIERLQIIEGLPGSENWDPNTIETRKTLYARMVKNLPSFIEKTAFLGINTSSRKVNEAYRKVFAIATALSIDFASSYVFSENTFNYSREAEGTENIPSQMHANFLFFVANFLFSNYVVGMTAGEYAQEAYCESLENQILANNPNNTTKLELLNLYLRQHIKAFMFNPDENVQLTDNQINILARRNLGSASTTNFVLNRCVDLTTGLVSDTLTSWASQEGNLLNQLFERPTVNNSKYLPVDDLTARNKNLNSWNPGKWLYRAQTAGMKEQGKKLISPLKSGMTYLFSSCLSSRRNRQQEEQNRLREEQPGLPMLLNS